MTSKAEKFRDILQISQDRVANLDDVDLNNLMSDLLSAHAHRCNGTAAEVRTSVEVKAKDDGCDGWTPASTTAQDHWFGPTPTCWQFKAGSAGIPSRLDGEISKPIPTSTLRDGSRFVLIASASTNGLAGENDRLDTLRKEAAANGLPVDRIEVIGADRLTRWCNEHPAVASSWAARPVGLKRVGEWIRSEVHETPWQSTSETEALLASLRDRLAPKEGGVPHLHIYGPPGVGKSRFALELCRSATWKDSVIYLSNAADFPVREILHSAVSEPTVQLVAVADEAQAMQLEPLRDALEGSGGRVRLITIGHSPSPDLARIPAQEINPLKIEQVRNIVSQWHPSLPRESAEFVAQFADGYIKLARLAANAAARETLANVRQLIQAHDIRSFLDRMLPGEKRQYLYVLAALTSVGWTEEMQGEGKAISEHFGWNWDEVRIVIERLDQQYAIAPKGGRRRYISPKPLAIYLAMEAWEALPDKLKSLPDILPSEEARKAYYARYEMLSGTPQTQRFSDDQLQVFFSVENYLNALDVRRWTALAASNPRLAARAVRHALSSSDVESRRRIAGDARRAVVGTLVKLACKKVAFHDATMALALLAEAENETWSNNATGEFKDRFGVFLGGTPVPYTERLTVIDDLLEIGGSALTKLSIAALARVGSQHEHRAEVQTLGIEAKDPEWKPRTGEENLNCVREAMARLTRVATSAEQGLLPDFVSVIDQLSMLLRPPQTRPLIVGLFEAIRKTIPEAREAIRRAISSIIQRETQFWNELSDSDVADLRTAESSFEENSVFARLQKQVGQSSFIKEEQYDLTSIADELISKPSLLADNWAWLTSGNAADSWRLGLRLGELDMDGALESVLGGLAHRGPDLRLVSGYVYARRETVAGDWFDRWLTSEMDQRPDDHQLLFEIATRVDPTATSIRLVVEALGRGSVEPRLAGQLAYGVWSQLELQPLGTLLQALTEGGFEETAIAVLFQRLKDKPSDFGPLESLAVALATSRKLIQSKQQMIDFYWENVARRCTPGHPDEIASAICDAHAEREPGWMVEFSGAKKIILELADKHPTSVWRAMKSHLTRKREALLFPIGFPRNVIDKVPAEEVMSWISEEPPERGSTVAHLASKDFSSDETLACQILGEYGGLEVVGSSFFSSYISGMFRGSSSAHWDSLADNLAEVGKRTKLSRLRRWALSSEDSLRKMAAQDRQQEEEERLSDLDG